MEAKKICHSISNILKNDKVVFPLTLKKWIEIRVETSDIRKIYNFVCVKSDIIISIKPN